MFAANDTPPVQPPEILSVSLTEDDWNLMFATNDKPPVRSPEILSVSLTEDDWNLMFATEDPSPVRPTVPKPRTRPQRRATSSSKPQHVPVHAMDVDSRADCSERASSLARSYDAL